MKQSQTDVDEFKQKLETLSEREKQIIELVLTGEKNANIGLELNISVKTVELYRGRAVKKLGIRTHPELFKMMMACR